LNVVLNILNQKTNGDPEEIKVIYSIFTNNALYEKNLKISTCKQSIQIDDPDFSINNFKQKFSTFLKENPKFN